MAKVTDFDAIKIRLASPEEIFEWSRGEVTKPETINYRTQRPEKDGLFCERIFGPERDWECYCGKYKRIRYKGVICDKCGVEVTRSIVRRERMGHIKLIIPVSHIWFLKGVPSKMGLLLDIPVQQLEKVIYYASYVVTRIDEEARERTVKNIEKEFQTKSKAEKSKIRVQQLRNLKTREIDRLRALRRLLILTEIEYHELSLKYAEVFEAGIGSEAIRQILADMDLLEVEKELSKNLDGLTPVLKRKLSRRIHLLRRMRQGGVRPEWMFITTLPVIPPDLRPMVQLDGGRYATSDLNDLYRRVINRNNRLKHLEELNAPEVIKRNEKRMLQEAVDALIDNSARKGQAVTAAAGGRRPLKSIADLLRGKQGRFRQNLLGKRVDYSGRSVIVVGPELKLGQCGLPKKMALELFKPFVIQKLLERELAYNIRGAAKLIEEASDEVWAILEEVIKGKYVLLNRAPTLHRLGIQAFKPILIEGEAIRIHPMVCTAFNADFDGDQMAVHVPLSIEAQKEAGEIMLSSQNILKPATGAPITLPTKDIVLGCYYLTRIEAENEVKKPKRFSDAQDALLAYEHGHISLKERIQVRVKEKGNSSFIETSAGRIMFNEVLPDEIPYINEEMDSKRLEKLLKRILDQHGLEVVVPVLDDIKRLGFEYSTLSSVTWGMDDLTVPANKFALIEEAEKEISVIQEQYTHGLLTYEERKTRIIEVWYRVIKDIAKEVPKTLDPYGPVYSIVASGARGSWSQPTQMMGMKGLLANPAGEVIELPVKSSYKEGFNVLEYFIATHGARKGTADTALRTATAGYLTRRLVDVAQELFISEDDCRDTTGFTLTRKEAEESGQSYPFKLFGYVTIEDVMNGKEMLAKKGTLITEDIARVISDSGLNEVRVRSVLRCRSTRGICRMCYGGDFGRNRLVDLGEAVGIVAAQAIGEPGTQLTMRTFHTGGVAGGLDITQGLPRAEEIFEVRPPKAKAVISETGGKVREIAPREDGEIRIVIEETKQGGKKEATKKKKDTKETKEYIVSPRTPLLVAEGDLVAEGQQLTEGHVDMKELFSATDREAVERYIINQIQYIYSSQGATIHDKHIMLIVRQMFSRVRIADAGDTNFSTGEIVTHTQVVEENKRVKALKKQEATSRVLLLGITKASLTTESFLAAASFQETARVLINASIEGRDDKLRGLKENVIIGKLIPVGTGYRGFSRDTEE